MNIGSLYKIELSNVFPSTCIHWNNTDNIYNRNKFNDFMNNKCIRINYELEPIHPLDYSYDVDIYDLSNFQKVLSNAKLIGSQIKSEKLNLFGKNKKSKKTKNKYLRKIKKNLLKKKTKNKYQRNKNISFNEDSDPTVHMTHEARQAQANILARARSKYVKKI